MNNLTLTNGETLNFCHNIIYHHNKKIETKWVKEGEKLTVDLKNSTIIAPYVFIPQNIWRALKKGLYILEGN